MLLLEEERIGLKQYVQRFYYIYSTFGNTDYAYWRDLSSKYVSIMYDINARRHVYT